MKKVFLLSLGLILGLGAIAQNRVMKDDVQKSVVSSKKTMAGKEVVAETSFVPTTTNNSVVVNRAFFREDAKTMETTYDIMSNHFVANRMYQLPTGEVAVTTTMSHDDGNPNQGGSAPDRGTGYNFYKDGAWGEMPDARIETFKTGWPSIAQWGETGEILLCHGNNGMQCYTREVAGEGEWQHRGALPPYPDGYPYTSEYATWPRVVTCGDNHDIILAVGALQHSVTSDSTDVRTCFWRSTDATNWEVSYGPITTLDLGYEVGVFSADDYAMAANGHNVALIYSGCLTNSVWLFNSNDDGETWTSTKVWEHPFENVSLETPGLDYVDTLYMPMNVSIAIDNDGVTHLAMNTFEMSHFADDQPGYYTHFSGRGVDGIYYWNSTMEAPIQSVDGNPFHAVRLWWPIPGEPDYVHMENDSTKWIGFIPMFYDEAGALIEWNNDLFFHENDYNQKFWGASATPALSIDPDGKIACVYSAPTTYRTTQNVPEGNYLRGMYVSYYDPAEGYWHQIEQDLNDDFMSTYSECVWGTSVTNTVNPNEFWFSYMEDNLIGICWGSSSTNQHTQTELSVNKIHAVKVSYSPDGVAETEAQDVVYNIYPNPATDHIVVSSSMNANATITFVNLAGQTVKSISKNLTTGENSINIDLESGVYFCTVNANGFSKTTKVVVK